MKKTILLFSIIFSGYFLFGQNVGVDQSNPVNKLDINGNLSVGSNYSGTFTAPSNGAIFEGQVGIGTAMPMADLDVNGTLRVGSLIGAGTSMVVADANGNLSIQTIPTDGQTLSLSGSNLSISGGNSISLPFALPYSAGVGISISGSTLINTGDTDASNDITTSTSAAGDVSGIFPTLSVDKIKGRNVSATAPASDQVLKWNGTEWAPATDGSVWSKNGTTAFYNDGRVAIGKNNPLAGLDIRTDSSAISGSNVNVSGLSMILSKHSNSNTENAVGIGFGSSSDFGINFPSVGAAIIHQRINNGSIGKLHFATKPVPGGAAVDIPIRMTIDHEGDVGIGFMDPTEKLHVNGNIRVADDADIFGLDQIVGFNDLRLSGDATGGTDLLITTEGKVGINDNPSNVMFSAKNISSNSAGLIMVLISDANQDKWQTWNNGHSYAIGNFSVTGTKNFIMDHPLDPANKNLTHNAVESPNHVTYYHGTVVLSANGSAQVNLPDYFEALNTDFHYQLTCVGGFAQVYISEKIANNTFSIAGGTPGLEVSWQVTATRNDPYVRDHPYQAEQEKRPDHRGKYWYPEGYGEPASMKIGYREPEVSSENE